MKHLAPACFRAFACAAGACPDSCCRAGWEIVPDGETLRLYESLPGPEGDRVRAGIVPAGEPLLRQNEARVCVLLDADGLCCVQRRFGHEALCRVCRDYPRFRRDFGNLTEHGLSLSCPTAYALAVSGPPVWEEWEDEAPIVPNELDPAAYLGLRKGRDLALELLAREELPLWTRITLVHRLASALQTAPERMIRHDPALRLRRWGTTPGIRDRGFRSRGRAGFRESCGSGAHGGPRKIGGLAQAFLRLEILSPEWKEALERFLALGEQGKLPAGLLETKKPETYARWLWYSLYKYWLDALDDGNLLGRVDRSVGMLLLGLAMDNTFPDEGPFLRRISREIEHCEENLEALLKPNHKKKL